MSMQPDEIAAAEALTLLDAGTSYTADTAAWRSKAWFKEYETLFSKARLSLQPALFPTLSDDEEKRLDRYIKAIIYKLREVRINVDSYGLLSDCVRLVREDEIIQARVSGQAPKEVAERAYRDSKVLEEVEELSKYLLFGKHTPDALSRSGRQLGSHNATRVMSILCSEESNFLPGLMSLYFSLPVSNDIYTISREPSVHGVLRFCIDEQHTAAGSDHWPKRKTS
ncbi:hypothetical protein V8E54_012761 [Elaphomyces granulatus]